MRAELKLQVLHEFNPATSEGINPLGGLTLGSDGSFYGTTAHGGVSRDGTVFKFIPGVGLSTLFSFDGTNGFEPFTSLVQGKDGRFYGTTRWGGTNIFGTVFRITTNGTLTTMFSFNGTNGATPSASLVESAEGDFFGSTETGGNGFNGQANSGFGTVFKISLEGELTTLIAFNGTNGSYPRTLLRDSDGSLLGIATEGGPGFDGSPYSGFGSVFRLTTNGMLSTLVSFSGTNGSNPLSLAQAVDGSLYGTTFNGGIEFTGDTFSGLGTAFKITTNGQLTTLVYFDGSNGAKPVGLTRLDDGLLYGSTYYGPGYNTPSNNFGTSFRIGTNDMLETLVSFSGPTPWFAYGAVVRGADGNIYGTAHSGGTHDKGLIFRLVNPPRITEVARANGNTTLSWSAFSNGTYRVEWAGSVVSSDWTSIGPDITALGQSASFSENSADVTNRYYRVLLLPSP